MGTVAASSKKEVIKGVAYFTSQNREIYQTRSAELMMKRNDIGEGIAVYPSHTELEKGEHFTALHS